MLCTAVKLKLCEPVPVTVETLMCTFVSQVSAHHAKRKIAQCSDKPIEFLSKYDELKAKK